MSTDLLSSPDPHSHYALADGRVTHLQLALAVDFDQRILAGTATWHLTESGAAALALDVRGLLIQAVQLDDTTAANFTLGPSDPVLGQMLHIGLAPDTRTVTVHYQTAPSAAALQWLRPEQTTGTQPFLFTQSQAILARTWLPCQDSPGIRFTYEATVQVPPGLLALMSADNPQQPTATGLHSFRMTQPIPSYLMALAVGELTFAPLSFRTGIYAEPATLAPAAEEFADLEKMVAGAEELYGEYQWGRYDLLVLPPSFPFGGMENPKLTFVTPTIIAGDRSLTSLVAHELAHSWSGNLVTNGNWDSFWLNEGFTVYFERRIMEQLYGRPYADMLQVLGRADLHHTIKELGAESADTHLRLNLADRDPDEGMTEIAYEKGCALLLTLESLVGRARLDSFIKEYFAQFRFQAMDTDTFVAYLQTHQLDAEPGLEARLQLHDWIDGPGLPANAPPVSSTRFAAVDEALSKLAAGAMPGTLSREGWSSHEWVHFLHGLPPTLTAADLAQLDNAFNFTNSGNSEVAVAWFAHALRAGYAAVDEALTRFLLHVGRRKFLVPLYRALLATPDGLARAQEIYSRARPNYHSVATSTLDDLLHFQPS
jgi:leukotriene-A4 hydrolase